MSNPSPLRVLGVLGLGAVVLSFASIIIRLTEAPSLVIAAGRLTVASLVLAPFFWTRLPRERTALPRRDWLLVGLAGLFLALHFAAWVESLRHTTVTSSVVLVAMDPIFVALLAPFVLRERISWRTGLAIGLGLAGMLIIASGSPGPGFALKGNLLALTGAVCAAGYLLVGRTVRPRLGLLPYVYVMYTVAAVLLLLAVAASGQRLVGYGWRSYGLILLLGLGPQLVGHTSFNWALRYLSAPAVAMGILFEPVGASFLAWLILAQPPVVRELAGGAVICCGIYLALTERAAPVAVPGG